jgi:dCTP deaminase
VILKAHQIAARLRADEDAFRKDPLVVTPMPDPSEIQSSGAASLDLRLGTWFVTLRQSRVPVLEVEEEVRRSAERLSFTPDQKRFVDEFLPSKPSNLTKSHYVPFGSRFILHPRNFVLAATLEWIRLPKDLAAYVVGRSSWGRRGLIIATAAGVHPGFTGCLTLELTNLGEVPISIKPGMNICQLFMHTCDQASDAVDKSPFAYERRPVLGKIKIDHLAEVLGRDME